MSSWDAFKTQAAATQSGATPREDTANRLWLERQRPDGSVQDYIARPAGNVACILQVDLTRDGASALESTVRQLSDTLGRPAS